MFKKASKEKKPFFKKWWFWLILIIAIVGGSGGSGNNGKDNTTPQIQTSMSAVTGQRGEAVTTKPEEVKPVEPVTEEPKAETEVVIAENATTTQTEVTTEATTEETNATTEEVVEKPVEEPKQAEPVGTDYVGNKNTKKFHYSWCSSVDQMKQSNKYFYTGTRDDMIAKGYKPCGNCHP